MKILKIPRNIGYAANLLLDDRLKWSFMCVEISHTRYIFLVGIIVSL